MIFDEHDFNTRLRQLISCAWTIFQNKVGNGKIEINKEASMQLQYAYILQSLIPLVLYENDEEIYLELEKSVKVDVNKTCEVDLLLIGIKRNIKYKIAIEMKCYRKIASSGGNRGASDIFMKDIYVDIEILEKYLEKGICNETVFLALNDLQRIVNPKNKEAKCWSYDISQGFKISGPKTILTPIGGKDQNITIKGTYEFNWVEHNSIYFLEL